MYFKKLSAEEEKEYRAWATDNYVPGSSIKGYWHPVVQEECVKINRENAVFVEPDPNVELLDFWGKPLQD